MGQYKLSYSGAQVDEKLTKVGVLESSKLDKLTTSGTNLYSHSGSEQGELSLESAIKQGLISNSEISTIADQKSIAKTLNVTSNTGWDLINTINADGESSEYRINKDNSNNNFLLMSCIIEIDCDNAEEVRNLEGSIECFNSADYDNTITWLWYIGVGQSDRKHIVSAALMIGGFWFQGLSATSGKSYLYPDISAFETHLDFLDSRANPNTSKYIQSVRVGFRLAPGSVIKIYGQRR